MFPHQSRCQRDWNHPRHHDHCPTHHLAWRKDAWSITASDNFTLQGTNISHLGKRKIIFKSALVGDMLVSGRVNVWGDLLWEFQLDMMISCPRPFLDSGENDTYSIRSTQCVMAAYSSMHRIRYLSILMRRAQMRDADICRVKWFGILPSIFEPKHHQALRWVWHW